MHRIDGKRGKRGKRKEEKENDGEFLWQLWLVGFPVVFPKTPFNRLFMQRSSSPDSLFKDDQDDEHTLHPPVAKRTCPPIPGLYVFPGLLPEDIASEFRPELLNLANFFSGEAKH